jgi:Domain of unknown function (DUF4390)
MRLPIRGPIRRPIRETTALLALLLGLLATPEARAEARIADLQVAVDGSQVLASVALAGAFDRRLAERLESGLPTSILYRFELHKDRRRWYDRQLREATVEAVALYDAVERQYTVRYKLDGKLVESKTVHDRAALEQAMTHLQRMPVFTLEEVPHRWRLVVKARAELGSRTILAIIPATIATDWAESRRFRSP